MTKNEFKLGPRQKAWVAALRSGKYEQSTGTLQDHYGVCCLGAASLECKLGEFDQDDYNFLYGDCLDEQPKVMEYYKIRDEEGGFLNENGNYTKIEYNGNNFSSLAEMNDNNCSFEDIADVIEEHAELIFEGPA